MCQTAVCVHEICCKPLNARGICSYSPVVLFRRNCDECGSNGFQENATRQFERQDIVRSAEISYNHLSSDSIIFLHLQFVFDFVCLCISFRLLLLPRRRVHVIDEDWVECRRAHTHTHTRRYKVRSHLPHFGLVRFTILSPYSMLNVVARASYGFIVLYTWATSTLSEWKLSIMNTLIGKYKSEQENDTKCIYLWNVYVCV